MYQYIALGMVISYLLGKFVDFADGFSLFPV